MEDVTNNVYDFVQYKLRALEREATHLGMRDVAQQLAYALDQYVSGSVRIEFRHGNPWIFDDIYEEDEIDT